MGGVWLGAAWVRLLEVWLVGGGRRGGGRGEEGGGEGRGWRRGGELECGIKESKYIQDDIYTHPPQHTHTHTLTHILPNTHTRTHLRLAVVLQGHGDDVDADDEGDEEVQVVAGAQGVDHQADMVVIREVGQLLGLWKRGREGGRE